MEKFRITKSMIILAGPTTGKSELTKKYPSVFVDQDNIFRNIDASYFRMKKDLQKSDPAELEKYLDMMDSKFVREALSYLRDGKNLLLSRLNNSMIPKFFAFIPNAKIHLMVWRDNPQEVFRLMNERDGVDKAIPFSDIDKWYKVARSSEVSVNQVWLKNGQYLEDILDIPGAKIDVMTKEANTNLAKSVEEQAREEDVKRAAMEVNDGAAQEDKEES